MKVFKDARVEGKTVAKTSETFYAALNRKRFLLTAKLL